MKKHFVIILLSFLIFSCEEIGPTIPALGPQDTGDRKILIEEFTGVQCVNCPQGSAEIENLIGLYGENLIAVSIHSGFFADPFDESLYDFRIAEGAQLEELLGEPVGYPSAVINRKIVPGKTILQSGQAAWAGIVANEINSSPLLSLNLDVTYDASSRDLSVSINALASESIGEEVKLTVMLTETDISDVQLTPSGKQADYKHKHVLRDMLSNFNGDPLGTLPIGQLVNEGYNYQLPADWVDTNCKVVAFIHKGGLDKEVLQVETTSISE